MTTPSDDGLVEIELDLPDDVILMVEQLAIINKVTFNEMFNKILREQLDLMVAEKQPSEEDEQ